MGILSCLCIIILVCCVRYLITCVNSCKLIIRVASPQWQKLKLQPACDRLVMHRDAQAARALNASKNRLRGQQSTINASIQCAIHGECERRAQLQSHSYILCTSSRRVCICVCVLWPWWDVYSKQHWRNMKIYLINWVYCEWMQLKSKRVLLNNKKLAKKSEWWNQHTPASKSVAN